MAGLSLCGSGPMGGVCWGRKGGLTVFVTGCVVSVSRLWCKEGPVFVGVCLERKRGGRPAASLGVVGLCVGVRVVAREVQFRGHDVFVRPSVCCPVGRASLGWGVYRWGGFRGSLPVR